jgi:hypothetical protein
LIAASRPGGQPSSRQAGSLTTWITQIVPLVIVGEGWSQRIVIHDVDDTWNSTFHVTFYTKDGQLFPVQTSASSSALSQFNFTVDAGKSLVIDLLPNFGSQKLGWAEIDQYSTSSVSGDYSGLGDMFGQVIYRKQSPGLPDFMCSMVLGGTAFERVTTFFDNTSGNYTGMGILTSDTVSSSPVSLRVTVRDLSGSVISQKTIQQNQRSLYWMNLGDDFPETRGIAGTFEVEPVIKYTTTLTGFSLQFAGNGAFTIITPFEN